MKRAPVRGSTVIKGRWREQTTVAAAVSDASVGLRTTALTAYYRCASIAHACVFDIIRFRIGANNAGVSGGAAQDEAVTKHVIRDELAHDLL